MQRPSKAISQEGVRKRAARVERALHVRSCAADAVKSLVEALEARVFLSVAPIGPGYASPIGVVLPISTAGPNNGGLSAPPSLAKTPAQLRGAYGLGQYGASNITFGGVQGDGSGQTIAIIDAYDDPNAASDLHNFDVAMGLSDPPSFIKVNENGDQTPANLPGTDPNGPGGTTGFGTWEEEESLDIEYSHAMAPKANIILVECYSSSYDDLVAAGVNWARYQPSVSVISMSFGGGEWSGETSYDSYFTTPSGHQGVTFIASTGDSGAYDPGTTTKDVEYPAISPNVLAVGGTKLTLTNSNTGLGWSSEKGWGNGTSSGSSNGGGGGVSTVELKPSYQANVVGGSVNGTPTNGHRTIPDISAEADPNAPGVALYDSYDFGASTPWLAGYEGGTSLSAPLMAGMIAVANQGRAASGLPTFDGPNELLPAIYALHANTSGPTADYHDITSGNNGYAAATGYDLVTGIGTPIANNLIPALLSIDTAPVITAISASPSIVTTQSTDVTLSVTATNSPTQVNYYVETDGTQGLQTDSDVEIGSSTNAANGFALDFGDYGPTPNGNFTIYAVAINSFGSSQVAIVDNLYTAGTGTIPTISALTDSPSTAVADRSFTLTAGSLLDSEGPVSFVNFYRESNDIPGLQVGPGGDTLVGSSTAQDGNGNWNAITTAPTVAGTYTYYAQSTDTTDSAGMSSAAGTSAVSVSLSVVAAAATQLVFTTPPANGFAGVTLASVIAQVEDQFGNLVTSDTSLVSLTLNGGSFAAGSSATANASGGIATFNNLAIIPTGSYTITASDGALAAVTSLSFTISPAASLSALVTTNGATTAVPGQPFTFTVTIANGGQTNVSGAAVSDVIPAGVTSYTFSALDNGQGATGYSVSGSGTGSGGINDTVNLPAGAIITYSFTCNVSPAATGALTDTATVSTPNGTVNPNANVNGSNQANQNSATLTLTPVADSYVAIAGSDPLAVGSVDVYTIVVTNNGSSAITGTAGTTGLTVADTFSSLTNVTYVSQVLYGTAAGNTQGASPVGSLTLGDILTMGAGAIVQYTITGTIADGAPSTLTDTVTLTPPAGTTDPDSANNSSSASASVSATPTAVVTGRSIFYLDSFFDGANTGAPTTADFNAIAPDKTPLMPGQSATFNNYSDFVRGIDGLFIDISGDPNPSNIVPSDFEFIVGNNSTPGTGSSPGSGWSALATAPTITPFPGQGVNNSDRFALTWPSGTISGKWVQVTVLADADTALATPDVFYFGSAPGDGGNSTTDAHVNATDEVNARNDPHTFLNRASISDPNDFNRDSFVNAGDESVARSNSTTFLTALKLISVPGLPNNAGVFAPADNEAAQTTTSASSAALSATAAAPSVAAASSTSASAPSAHVVSPAVLSRRAALQQPKGAPKVIPARSTAIQSDDQDQVDNNNLRSRLKALIGLVSPFKPNR